MVPLKLSMTKATCCCIKDAGPAWTRISFIAFFSPLAPAERSFMASFTSRSAALSLQISSSLLPSPPFVDMSSISSPSDPTPVSDASFAAFFSRAFITRVNLIQRQHSDITHIDACIDRIQLFFLQKVR